MAAIACQRPESRQTGFHQLKPFLCRFPVAKTGRSTDMNKRPELGSRSRSVNGGLWVVADAINNTTWLLPADRQGFITVDVVESLRFSAAHARAGVSDPRTVRAVV